MTTTTTRRRRAAALIGLTAILLAACGGGGDEEAASGVAEGGGEEEAPPSTAAPTTAAPTTAAPTTTEAPTTTAPETAAYSFDDTFDSDTGWVTGCNDVGCAGIEHSYFFEDIFAGEKEIDQHTDWDGQALFDVTMEAGIVDFGAGTPQGGVICHADPDRDTYYDFTIGPDGRGSVYRFEDGDGEALGGPFTVEGFVPGSTIVQAYCAYNEDGSLRLGMGINDETVVDVVDEDPLPPGEVGLITYGDTDELSTVHYELVTVRATELLG